MLIIIYNKNQYHDFILEGLRDKDEIRIIDIKRPNIYLFVKIIRKILSLCGISIRIPILYFKKDFIKELTKISKLDKILIKGIPDPNEIRAIANILTHKVEIHIWYWNPLNKEYKKKNTEGINSIIKKFHYLGYKMETYDKNDASQYNLTLRTQFYRFPNIKTVTEKFEYDFYFLGYIKDRNEEISNLEKQLQTLNFRVNFKVINKKSEEISYDENIKNIEKSKCIIDINQKGQSGMTLRPLEAIFYNRKLLTNNQNIITEDFYNPQNIFILGKDNLELLSQFINEKPIRISDEILINYDINNWIKYYLKN